MKRSFIIASWNAQGGCHGQLSDGGERVVNYLCQQLRRHDVDLCHLQEVYWCTDVASCDRWYTAQSQKGEPGPCDLHLLNHIQTRLSDVYDVSFTPYFSVPALHDREPFTYPAQFGCAMITRKRVWSKVHSDYIYGNGQLNTERYGNLGQPASRKGQITSYMGGTEHQHYFSVLGLHGLWSQWGKKDIPERFYQNSRIIQLRRRHRQLVKRMTTHLPLLLIGDLNYTSELACFAELCERTDLFGGQGGINLNAKWNITDTRTSWYDDTRLKPREADFAIASKAIADAVSAYTIDGHAPSDHALLRLTIGSQ